MSGSDNLAIFLGLGTLNLGEEYTFRQFARPA